MRIQILVVGQNKFDYLVDGELHYIRRLSHYCQVNIFSVKGEKITKKRSSSDILKVESKRLLNRILERSFVVILDRGVVLLNSKEFTKKIVDWQNRSINELIFVIGGPLGLGSEIKQRADFTLSLSKMTFTHDMTRLILLEQLYRCFSILRGEKYHK